MVTPRRAGPDPAPGRRVEGPFGGRPRSRCVSCATIGEPCGSVPHLPATGRGGGVPGASGRGTQWDGCFVHGTDEDESASARMIRPEEWPPPKVNTRVAAAIVLAGVVILVSLWRAWDAGHAGAWAVMRFFLILSGLMALTALFGYVFWRPRRGDPEIRLVEAWGRGATEIRASGPVFHLMGAMTTSAALLSLGAAVEIVLFAPGVPWVSVLLAAFGLPCAAFVVEVLRGGIRRGALLLTPDGIRQRGWTIESYLPWVSVAGVHAVHHGFPEIWVLGTPAAAWARRRTSSAVPPGPVASRTGDRDRLPQVRLRPGAAVPGARVLCEQSAGPHGTRVGRGDRARASARPRRSHLTVPALRRSATRLCCGSLLRYRRPQDMALGAAPARDGT